MAEEVEFRGVFRKSPKMNVVPGEWYLGFVCLSCASRFAVLEDPNGEGGTLISGRGGFVTTCPSCGTEHTYAIDRMVSFQSPSGLPASPAP